MKFNPFPGLRSFESGEAHLFFGRERQGDELLLRLGRTRFLAVVGTSGCGKSSLIRSGLIPSLYSGFMAKAGSTWRVAIFRPGGDPIGNLAAALNSPDVLGQDEASGDIARALTETTLRRSAFGLAECVRGARIPAHDNVLVIVDQFEEIFRFKNARRSAEAREEAVAFAKLLLQAARQQSVSIYIVLTMRSDFIGHCTEFPGLPEAVNEGQYLVPRMTRDELRLAITGPVAVGGGQMTPRLVTRLLNDVGDDPDQLPVLQHALMRTWTHWETVRGGEGWIDLEDYEAVGAMKNALSQHADEAFEGLETDRSRQIAERVFKALTEMNAESAGVRRPCSIDELAQVAETTTTDVIGIVDRFRAPGRSFLMPSSETSLSGRSIVDLSHESLMRVWSRLAAWAREEARSAEIYRRLAAAARLHARGELGLWRDPELQLAIAWRDASRPTAPWAKRYDPDVEGALEFLAASEKARNDARDEQERQRHRRLVAARRVAMIMGALSLAAIVLAGVALVLNQEARQQKSMAEREAASAKAARDTAERERLRAIDRAQEARTARSLAEGEAVKARREQERADREASAAREAEDAARLAERTARTAEDKERLAAVEAQAAERRALDQAQAAIEARQQADEARDAATTAAQETRRLARLALARGLASVAQRPWEPGRRDVQRLLARQAYLFHVANQGAEYDPDIYAGLATAVGQGPGFGPHLDAVRSIAVDPSARSLATGGDDGIVRVFDTSDANRPPTLLATGRRDAMTHPIRALAFDDTGHLLAVGAIDEPLRIWDLRKPARPVAEAPAGSGSTVGAVFDGSRVISAGYTGTDATGYRGFVTVWSLDPLRVEQALADRHPSRIRDVAASRDTNTVIAASDAGVLVWQDGHRSGAPVILGADRRVSAVAISEDGRWATAGTADGLILTWDLRRDTTTAGIMAAHTAAVTDLSYSADGLLASSSLDGSVKLTRRSAAPMTLAKAGGWIWAVRFAPAGDRVFFGGPTKQVETLISRPGALAERVCSMVNRNLRPDEWAQFVSDAERYQATCPNHTVAGLR
jgi:WD40 repeat protein